MPTLSGMLYTLRSLLRRSASDRETAEEIAFHLERETQRLVEQGLSPGEAHRRALHVPGSSWRISGATRSSHRAR